MKGKATNGRRTGLWRLLCIAGLLAFMMGAWTGVGWAAAEIEVTINGTTQTVTTTEVPSMTVQNAVAYALSAAQPSTITDLAIVSNTDYYFTTTDWNYLAGLQNLAKLDIQTIRAFASGADTVPNGCFQNTTKLESIILPYALTGIGDGAFNGCTGLAGISIPSGVDSIGTGAFAGCTSLQAIAMIPSMPPSTIGTAPFPTSPKITVLVHSPTSYVGWDTTYNVNLVELPGHSFMSMTGNPTTPIQLAVNGTTELTLTVTPNSPQLAKEQLFYTPSPYVTIPVSELRKRQPVLPSS